MRSMRFDRFISRVGRYEGLSLLDAVAEVGAAQAQAHLRNGPRQYFEGTTGVTPWALIEIAREGRPVLTVIARWLQRRGWLGCGSRACGGAAR